MKGTGSRCSRRIPPSLTQTGVQEKRIAMNWTVCIRARTHSVNKKKLARERTKTSRAERKGGKRRCVNRKEGSQTGSRSWKSSSSPSLPLPLPLSHWVYVWHLTGVGPAPSIHSSCVCLSTHRPLPLVGLDEEKEKIGGGRGSHTKQKLPLLRLRHPVLCKFLHPAHTHAHTAPFSLPLCAVPLAALDIREGWDVRERIHIQIAMTVTKAEKEC